MGDSKHHQETVELVNRFNELGQVTEYENQPTKPVVLLYINNELRKGKGNYRNREANLRSMVNDL